MGHKLPKQLMAHEKSTISRVLPFFFFLFFFLMRSDSAVFPPAAIAAPALGDCGLGEASDLAVVFFMYLGPNVQAA